MMMMTAMMTAMKMTMTMKMRKKTRKKMNKSIKIMIFLLNLISKRRLSKCLKLSLKRYHPNVWHNGKN